MGTGTKSTNSPRTLAPDSRHSSRQRRHFSSDPKMNSGCNFNMGQRWSAINEARMPVTDGTTSTTDCWTMRFSTSKGRGVERCQAPVMDHMLHPKPLNRGPVMHMDTHVAGMARWPLEGIAERCVPSLAIHLLRVFGSGKLRIYGSSLPDYPLVW